MFKSYKVFFAALISSMAFFVLSVANAAPVSDAFVDDSARTDTTLEVFAVVLPSLVSNDTEKEFLVLDVGLFYSNVDSLDVVIVSTMAHPAEKRTQTNDSIPTYYALGLDKVPWQSFRRV